MHIDGFHGGKRFLHSRHVPGMKTHRSERAQVCDVIANCAESLMGLTPQLSVRAVSIAGLTQPLSMVGWGER